MKIPMKEKYIDEIVGVWFEFGGKDGRVDISDGNNISLFENIPRCLATQMCDAQLEFRNKLYKLIGFSK